MKYYHKSCFILHGTSCFIGASIVLPLTKLNLFFVDIHLTFSCVLHRFDSIQSCVQQLAEFRSRSGSLLRWLQTAQEQLPAKEPNLSTESLQRRAQQLKVRM